MNTDVVVIGGGPAGSAAAITALNAGLRVVIVEREAFPRQRPGETLHPGCEALFRCLGVWEEIERAGFLRHTGNWLECRGDRSFMEFGRDQAGPWRGFQACRDIFDSILLQRARHLGALILQQDSAQEMLIKNGQKIGILLRSGGEIRASFLIDSGGAGHWLARQAGFRVELHSRRMTAYYNYVRGKCDVLYDTPLLEFDEQGWTWMSRIDSDIFAWARLKLGSSRQGIEPAPAILRGLLPLHEVCGADVTWRRVVPAASEGVYCAGDAAAVFDPACGHGILRAIMSGIMSAHVIAAAVGGSCTLNDSAAEYDRWLGAWFQHDKMTLTELYLKMGCDPRNQS